MNRCLAIWIFGLQFSFAADCCASVSCARTAPGGRRRAAEIGRYDGAGKWSGGCSGGWRRRLSRRDDVTPVPVRTAAAPFCAG